MFSFSDMICAKFYIKEFLLIPTSIRSVRCLKYFIRLLFLFFLFYIKQIVFVRVRNHDESSIAVLIQNMAPEEGPNNLGRKIQEISQQTKFQHLAESLMYVYCDNNKSKHFSRAYYVSSSNYFMYIISLNPHNNPMMSVVLLSPYLR